MLGWIALWLVACLAAWTWQQHRLRRRYAVVGLDLAGLVALLPDNLRDRQYLDFIISPNSDRTLHTWPARRVLELAPAYWKQTLEQEDTQQRLAANVFRTVTLAEHHANV